METLEGMGREIVTAPSTAKPGSGGTSKPSAHAPSGTKGLREMHPSTFNPPAPAPNPLAHLLPPVPTVRRPELSVVICSINDEKFAQIENIYKQVLQGEDYEIVRINDAKSMCEGYTRGAKQAAGRILVFSHDDAAPVRPFASKLRAHLRQVDIVSGAGTDRLDGAAWFTAGPPHVFGQVLNNVPTKVRLQHPDGRFEDREQPPFQLTVYGVPKRLVTGIQAFDGFWFAMNREVLDEVQFDAEMCDGFHLYDVDFSFRAHLRGVRVGVATDLSLMHASTGGYADPKWKPAADKWLAKYGNQVAQHHHDLGFQMTAVTGNDIQKMLAVMDSFVCRAEE